MRQAGKATTQLDKRFAFYHQNEALLYQFLIYESLRAYQVLRKRPTIEILSLVLGSFEYSSDNWHTPQGHLPRLVHYCFLLSSHFEDTTSSLCQTLRQTLERAALIAHKCYALLEKKENYFKLFTNLRREIRTFMRLLMGKLHDFKDNASVLHFLLRHQEQLDAVYREPVTYNLFCTFFPEGLKQAKLFLTEKFSKKGFHHLIPYIEHKLKHLDSLCKRYESQQ